MKQRRKLVLMAIIIAFALAPTAALAMSIPNTECIGEWNFGILTGDFTLYTGWESTSAPAVANQQTGGMTIEKAFIGAVVIALAVAVATFVWIKNHGLNNK